MNTNNQSLNFTIRPGSEPPVSLAAIRTHFHARTSVLNLRNEWKQWKGYTVSETYDDAELEYFALRNSAGVFDLCPLNKYRIRGKDARAYVNRLVTRNVYDLPENQVSYVVWCDDAGKVIDDGTLFHLRDAVDYRLCAYERHLPWLQAAAIGFDVTIENESADVAALALQGPTACGILRAMGLSEIEFLAPFSMRRYDFAGGELMVSRTGFTADLGYELWIKPNLALTLWDALFEAGQLRGIRPIGNSALELARIEAGFLQGGVDFISSTYAVRPGRARSPFELGLSWQVDFDKPNFNGRRALLAEKSRGSSTWRFLRLDVAGNKPAEHAYVYAGQSRQIGFVTSAAWSPVCKSNVALASVKMPYGQESDDLHAEIYYQREMHWSRTLAKCQIVRGGFWNPPRRNATPAADF